MHLRLAAPAVKLLLLLVCALISRAQAETASVAIGGTHFEIPAPSGFSPVTPQMRSLNELLEALTPAVNARLTAFIPGAETATALQDKVPELTRYFSVQTSRKLMSRTITKAEFDTVKDAIRKQNEQVMKEAEKQVPGLLEKMNKDMTKAFGADSGVKSINMIPFAPHLETDRSLAFSMVVNYTATAGSSATAEARVGMVTGTLVHLRGKILYLYANGGEKDLEWTRQASRDWSAAVIAANPSDAAMTAKESSQLRRGFDWSRVVRGAIIGGICGICGAIFGLLRYLKKKRNPE